MTLDAIQREVDKLRSGSSRLEGLVEQHPQMSEALLTIAWSVRHAAAVLAVLAAVRSPSRTERVFRA
jgi:hypothetical protein